ncbi:MAG: NAD(P)-dependent oxidoreductase [Solirubrobacteraceae bacterium]
MNAVERVGFIGLGNMGGPMCGHLVKAGFDVTAFDLSSDALSVVVEAGARAARSALDCASAVDALITMLPAPPHVQSVLLGADGSDGVIGGLGPGTIAIDMSTSSVAVGSRVAAAARERGVDVLDAPVAGQSIGAKAGTLAIYVGGDPDVFERARPLFDAMGDPARVFHLGPNGTGYTVKLLLNLMWFIESVAVGEVLSLGVKAGVPLDRLHEALVGSPANSVFLERDVRMVLDDGDYDEAFPMRLVTKDLGLAVDLAAEVGVPAELTALVEQVHRRARNLYGDDAGEISAVRLYEDLAGVQLRLPH